MTLAFRQHRQLRNLASGIFDDAFEQRSKVRQHSRDRFVLEKIGVRFKQAVQFITTLNRVKCQIEIRHDVVNAKMLDLQSRKLQRQNLFALQHEHDLKQRVVRQCALGLKLFDQTLERKILMRISSQ